VNGRHRLVTGVLAAGGTSVSLGQTLVIPLIPELPRLLDTGPSEALWVITVTLLAAAVAMPVFGRLGDMYGAKRMLIVCTVLLTAGSVLIALTSTALPVIVGRALQGLGMPIIPLGIGILREVLPPEKMGSAMGLISSSLGVGGALGLPLSAVIAQSLDWHALFWLSAVLGAGTGLLVWLAVPATPGRPDGRFDFLGVVLLAVGLVSLLLGITRGAVWGPVAAVALFATAVVGLGLFGVWELRTRAPLVDLRTSARREVLSTNVVGMLSGFAMFAIPLIAPQLLQAPVGTGYGVGLSLIETGLWLAPGGVAMMAAAPLAARLSATRGPRATLIAGCAVVCVAYLFGQLALGAGLVIVVMNILVSIGVGACFAALPALINAAVPVSATAAANGLNALGRSVGTSTSSAILGAVLAGLSTTYGDLQVPTEAAFRIAFGIAAGAAALAVVVGLTIPRPRVAPAELAPAARLSAR
jgi:MFS family permease